MTRRNVLAVAGVVLACSGGAAAGGCSSGDGASGSSNRADSSSLRCYNRASNPIGGDPDCVAQNLPRKLHCDDETDKQVAMSYGCKEEKPGDEDVCCPASVLGGVEPIAATSADSGSSVDSIDSGTAAKDAGKDASSGLGIGEPCTSETQCRSGICYRPGGAVGWCTTSCSVSFDYRCFGDYAGGDNSRGGYNACMPFAGGGRCYPGCVKDTCFDFSRVRCQKDVNDIKNYNVYVCGEL